MTFRYVLQAVRRRPLETLAAAIAVAVTVAFLASLASFVAQTGSQLAERAAARVPIDWQVQVAAGGSPEEVTRALQKVSGLTGFRSVDYAKVPGLRSSAAGATRTTGAAYVVAVPPDYASFAPSEIRPLLGTARGAVLQQQTAANLAAGPNAVVQVLGSGRTVRVTGVVDLPNADSFFQVVGAPPGSTPAAAPDNVLLVPPADFPGLVGTSAVVRQLHVHLQHSSLSSNPSNAADEVARRANHFVSSVAGGALVGDNLEASLSAAREDALYARLLVLLLGLPGLALSGVVTALVLSLRNDRQRRDLALLRLRGITPGRAARLLGLLALVDGLLGAAVGAGGSLLANRLALGPGAHLAPIWLAVGAAVGVALAVATELTPVVRLLRGASSTVASDAAATSSIRTPLVLRLGVDFLLLAGSALVFWLTSRGGYKVVVVPEGVPVASVNYAALLAPTLAWPGLALLTWRLTALVLGRRVRRPVTDGRGTMVDLRREVVRRRRHVLARGATGLAVAVAVTLSAAIFTRTYDEQARLDTALTVGSDVAVTLPPDSALSLRPALVKAVGVTAIEQVTHRLSYVGPDLQDLYGVDATTIGRAAPLQDAFTPGSSVRGVLRRLAATRDGALLSQETLHDYQLRTGDLVRLRLRNASGTYVPVPFHVVGVVTEFATAPRDSFIVANRSYVAEATGRASVETLLVRTSAPARVAAAITDSNSVPPGALVNDITAPRVAVPSASGLAAGSLAGLAALTLTFGLLLATASAGLVLLVGAFQRRRPLVALAVLGASARQRARFLESEARAVVIAGLLGGIVTGAVIAQQLVKVLTGIFDPPPEHLVVPWPFVLALLSGVGLTGAVVAAASSRWAGRADASRLRDL